MDDITIEFAVNGYVLRVDHGACRLFRTAVELSDFFKKELDKFHSNTMKNRLGREDFESYLALFDKF